MESLTDYTVNGLPADLLFRTCMCCCKEIPVERRGIYQFYCSEECEKKDETRISKAVGIALKKEKTGFVLEDYGGNPLDVLHSTSVRGAALMAARRGHRDIRLRYQNKPAGTQIYRYESRHLARPGKFSNERHLNVTRKGSYYRRCGIAAYIVDAAEATE